jgi:hypothetical protein
LSFIVENGLVRTTGQAGITPDAVIIHNDHHTSIVKEHGLGRTCQDTLRRIAVLANENLEFIPDHIFDNDQSGQAQVAFTLMVKRTGQDTSLAIATKLGLHLNSLVLRHEPYSNVITWLRSADS